MTEGVSLDTSRRPKRIYENVTSDEWVERYFYPYEPTHHHCPKCADSLLYIVLFEDQDGQTDESCSLWGHCNKCGWDELKQEFPEDYSE